MNSDLKYKMVAFDLDGTLVDDNKEILPSTFSSVMQIQEMGIKVVLATGRPTYGCTKVAEQLRLTDYGGYLISYNGGKVTSLSDGNILARNTISLHILPQLRQLVHECGAHLLSYRRNEILTEVPEHDLVKLESWFNGGMPITGVNNLEEAIDKEPFKYAVFGDSDKVLSVKARLEQEFRRDLNCILANDQFLEISREGVDKGAALDFLLKDQGVSRQQLIAVGDNYNDLGMIRIAGLGVAMANAPEAIKRSADYVTTSNTSNGIQHLINKYILYPQTRDADVDISALNALTRGTLMESLGIICTRIEDGYVEATMPVDHRTRQPMGILHGGASLALAETVAGYGSTFLLKPNEIQVGMQVSGNHIKTAHEGDTVRAEATILHRGRTSHVWNVNILNESGQLVSTVRVVNNIRRQR